jgi:hypothetical protein
MTTNDEIIDKEDERLGREKEEDNLFGYQSVNRMLNEARADTADHIFADLKKHETGYGDIVLPKEELLELEKKYRGD